MPSRSNSWAELVRAVRAKYRLSGADLAKLCCVTRNTVYFWETGQAIPAPFPRMIIAQLRQAAEDDGAFREAMEGIEQGLSGDVALPVDLPARTRADPKLLGPLVAALGIYGFLRMLFGGKAVARRRPKRRARKKS